ncbi:hypothetical protein FSP39_009930 [Pinctada imbricata]|uniref:Sulfurtransferase n=1 Tax=Pinctada imbricata TaxID=66713 RepID=A0AA89BWQ0_PINIB|nr:hypothetical protein FSP39_009930 [Pinctada imbricata]
MVCWQSLVSAKWLHNALRQPDRLSNLRVLDSTGAISNAKENYLKKHIPGALYFDVEECIDKASKYPNMLPSPKEFEQYVGDLGISNKTHIVVYDTTDYYGFFSAQRAWWMFKVFGHDMVSVLDGGFKLWCDHGFETTDKIDKVSRQSFKAKFHPEYVKSFEDIIGNQCTKEFQVLDARSTGRFHGNDPEPRDDTKSGHMKGSISVPFKEIIDPNTKRLKTPEELKALFTSAGVDMNKPMVTSCGSGITACCLAFAASVCGKEDVAVFDGSWTEFYLRSKPEHRVCPTDKQ